MAKHPTPKSMIVMRKSQAIITDAGSVTGHMASPARGLAVPSILDAKVATDAQRAGGGDSHRGKKEGAEMGNLAQKLQAIKLPPVVKFDYGFTPGGRSISWMFLVLSGALVGKEKALARPAKGLYVMAPGHSLEPLKLLNVFSSMMAKAFS